MSLRYSNATRVSIFNHKGGVGKTTLTFNIAAALARSGRRVLLVDTDPQCNLTSYLIASEVVDDLLDKSDGPNGRTIWSALKPLHEALGGVRLIEPIESSVANMWLIPGDISLSQYESDLGDFWSECLQRKARGFRGTTAVSELINDISTQLEIDYVFYDSGPNIGPLNRVVLLDCDFFIVPVACDLFSLRALKTLGITLATWTAEWKSIASLAPTGTYLLPGEPKFMGYIPEGFRIYRGVITAQSEFLARIQKEVHSQIATRFSPPGGQRKTTKLGEVQNFATLVTLSQDTGQPMFEVQASSDLVRRARRAFESIASRIDALAK